MEMPKKSKHNQLIFEWTFCEIPIVGWFTPSFHGFHRRKCKIPSKYTISYDIFEKYDQWSSENNYVSKITHQFIYFKAKIVRK
jgi:hypothetical protein